MKTTSKLIIFVITFLAPTASAYAQSPREQLQPMVEQLQKTPTDDALRERIIKLGAEIKPALAIPEEANRLFVRGNVFQKEAKDASGYELAISAYRDALRVAPWWGDAYFNLAVALESANKFDEAIASIKLFMASVPGGSAEAREAQNRIYAIEAKSEMALRQAKAEAQQAQVATQAQRYEGNWFRDVVNSVGDRARLTLSIKRDAGGAWRMQAFSIFGSLTTELTTLREIQLVGTELQFKQNVEHRYPDRVEVVATNEIRATLSADGNSLRLAYTPMPFTVRQAAHWADWSSWVPKPYVDVYQRQ